MHIGIIKIAINEKMRRSIKPSLVFRYSRSMAQRGPKPEVLSQHDLQFILSAALTYRDYIYRFIRGQSKRTKQNVG